MTGKHKDPNLNNDSFSDLPAEFSDADDSSNRSKNPSPEQQAKINWVEAKDEVIRKRSLGRAGNQGLWRQGHGVNVLVEADTTRFGARNAMTRFR